MNKEARIFKRFLRSRPDFALQPIREWHTIEEWYSAYRLPRPPVPYHERPDIICVTEQERRIGIELKGWVNQAQIAGAKRQERIRQNMPGGFYTNQEMLATLCDLVNKVKADSRYENLCARVNIDESYLLIHYDEIAFEYNTPIGDPDFPFRSVAKYVSNTLQGNPGYFHKIFLFIAIEGQEMTFGLV